MTGCQTPPKPVAQVTPLMETQRLTLPPVEVPMTTPPVETTAVEPPSPPPRSVPAQTNLNRWIAWESWCQEIQIHAPQKAPSPAVHSFELHTAQGMVAITAGSRIAYWEGLACWLGFAPKLVVRQLHIHALDGEKSFLPLLVRPEFSCHTSRVVVIDPGHGGRDPGTQHILNGRYEKEFTLDWAVRIQRLLSTNGWKVYLTRTNDQEVALTNRVCFADQCQADLFISLHFNSGLPHNGNRAGIETFCLTPAGMPSSLTRGYDDNPQLCFPNNDFDQQNFYLASRLHRALIKTTGSQDQGVQRARFLGVLRGQKRPAVLIEGGFLSNHQEARLIGTVAYREKLAGAVAKALAELPMPSQAATPRAFHPRGS